MPDRGWLAGNELQGRAGFAGSLISRQVLEILGNEMESRGKGLRPKEKSHLVSGIFGKGGVRSSDWAAAGQGLDLLRCARRRPAHFWGQQPPKKGGKDTKLGLGSWQGDNIEFCHGRRGTSMQEGWDQVPHGTG